MKTCRFVVAFSLALSFVATAVAQEPPKPTEAHKVLRKEAGAWDAKMKIWMPGAEKPEEATGTEFNKLLGGMWVASVFKGELFGQEFEGRAALGYDSHKKKYGGSWIDSMEPHMSRMEGTWDKKTSTMTLIKTGVDPETGKPRIGKNVTVYDGRNSRKMTLFMKMPDGEFVKYMEIVYTRRARKSGAKSDKKTDKKTDRKTGKKSDKQTDKAPAKKTAK